MKLDKLMPYPNPSGWSGCQSKVISPHVLSLNLPLQPFPLNAIGSHRPSIGLTCKKTNHYVLKLQFLTFLHPLLLAGDGFVYYFYLKVYSVRFYLTWYKISSPNLVQIFCSVSISLNVEFSLPPPFLKIFFTSKSMNLSHSTMPSSFD